MEEDFSLRDRFINRFVSVTAKVLRCAGVGGPCMFWGSFHRRLYCPPVVKQKAAMRST